MPRGKIQHRVQSDGLADAGIKNRQIDARSRAVQDDIAGKLHVLYIAGVGRGLVDDLIVNHESIKLTHEELGILVAVEFWIRLVVRAQLSIEFIRCIDAAGNLA